MKIAINLFKFFVLIICLSLWVVPAVFVWAFHGVHKMNTFSDKTIGKVMDWSI